MLLGILKKIVESETKNAVAKIDQVAKSLNELSVAVAQLADVVRDQQTTIFRISFALKEITHKMRGSGIDTDLPEIKFSNDDEPN